MAYYDNISLEKGFYQTGLNNFSAELERLDSSENYKNTELEGLDAFERQLKRFDIKVKGANSSNVEKFFSSTQASVLFPEYVRRCVLAGINQNNPLTDIVATKTYIDGLDYRPITCVNGEGDDGKAPKVLEEGVIPTTKVKTQANLVSLIKRGRILASTYEALRYKRLDLFSVMLKQIGSYIAKAQLGDAIDTIVSGDGNGNEATSIAVKTAGTLTYADLITLWGKFTDYEMNRMIVAPDVMQKMLAIDELKNPLTGLNFQATGKLTTPLGATLYQSEAVAKGKIIALDKNCSIEEVTAYDVMVDYDKLIDRQLEEAAISSVKGFAKIFKDASIIMTV